MIGDLYTDFFFFALGEKGSSLIQIQIPEV